MLFRWKTSHKDYFLQSLPELFASHELSDVVLVCEDNSQFKAHKLVLRAFSEVFKGIFANNLSSSVVFLRGVKSELMEALLTLLYLGETTISSESVPEFLSFAGSLKISELTDLHNNMKEEMKEDADVKNEPLNVNLDEETNMTNQRYTAQDILKKMEARFNAVEQNQFPKENDQILQPQYKFQKVQCPKCKVWFRSTKIMENHFQKYHNNKTYSCSFCNFQSKRADIMVEHGEATHGYFL